MKFDKKKDAPKCACGCGKGVGWNRYKKKWNLFVIGHKLPKSFYKPKPPKSPPQLCECGCGGMTNKGARFIWGHHSRNGKHPMQGKSGILSPNYGKHYHTEEFKKQRSINMTGENNPMWGKFGALNPSFGKTGKLSSMYGVRGANHPASKRKGPLNNMYGKKGPLHPSFGKCGPLTSMWNKHRKEEVIKKISKSSLQNWKNPKYVEKIRKGWKNPKARPNNPERKLLKILNKLYPGKWRYSGDFSFMINGKNPDFTCNAQKKLIELFGDYWHKGQNPQDRIDVFKPFGWDTLVIWEKELRNLTRVRFKIINFMNKS